MVSLSTTKPMSVIGIALDFILPPPMSLTYLASQPDSQSPPPPHLLCHIQNPLLSSQTPLRPRK
jgi:hypothetical protein